ncbi:MAG: glycosyltransferase family 4 protein [Wenzhouxiangella sp.]
MKIALLAPSDAYLLHFRAALATALVRAGHEVLLVSPSGPYGFELSARGFRWVAAPMNRSGLNAFYELRVIFWLYRLFRRERVDLVHGFIFKGALYGALAGRLAGVRARVSSITGMGYLFLSQDWLARALRFVVRVLCRLAFAGAGSRVVLQNGDDLDLFRAERLARSDKLVMIPGSGVDCVRFSPATGDAGKGLDDAPSTASQSEFRVLLPARLLWHKGLREYMEAAQVLRDQGRDVKLLLAGEPDPSNPTSIPESTVRDWTERGLVEWLGYVEDMPALLHTVDAVVLPSYREGLPKALVEGAACALPLITTDVPGCRQVVTNGVEGLLVPVADPNALAAAIVRLQDDPQACREMGQRARAKALAEFEEGIIISRMFAVYGELLPEFDANAYVRAGPT